MCGYVGGVVDEVRFRSEDGLECIGTLYRPDGDQTSPLPCVVMGNGVSMTRRDGVPRFAERFAGSGFAALAFDFRHLGDSAGEPRHLIDYKRQCADFRAAVSFARSSHGLDPRRIALWGFSLGGGVALACAIDDADLAAAVLLCPLVDGLAFSLAGNLRNNLRVLGLTLRSLIRHEKATLRVAGSGDGPVLLAQAEAAPGFEAVKGHGSSWTNEVCVEPMRPAPRFRPVRGARQVNLPLLICLGSEDTVVPERPIVKVTSRAPAAELRRFPISHFGGFTDGFEAVVAEQVRFLRLHLDVPDAPAGHGSVGH